MPICGYSFFFHTDHNVTLEEESSESSEDEKCSKRVSTSPSLFEKSKVPKM